MACSWRGESRGVAALLASQDQASGAWIADVGYKLNLSFHITHAAVPHVGVTGLALDALLSAAPRPWSPRLHTALGRAASFLMESQAESGYLSAHGTRMRSHAHALVALSHWQELEPNAAVAQVIGSAAKFTIAAQNDAGGWRFKPRNQDADVLETSYQVRALLRAQSVGVSVSPRVLVRALDCVRSMGEVVPGRPNLGVFRFQSGPKARVTGNTVAAGFLTSASLAPVEARFGKAALAQITRHHRQDHRMSGSLFLAWDTELLSSLALATYAERAPEQGAIAWARWRAGLRSRLAASQLSSGAWVCTPGPTTAYSTAIACLLLSID